MSLRLKDGPRTSNTNSSVGSGNRAKRGTTLKNDSNNYISHANASGGDDNTLFTLSGDADRLLDSVLQANRGGGEATTTANKEQFDSSTSNQKNNNTTKTKQSNANEVLDELLFSNDDRSDSESTALSSFVPIVNSSQIRKNAPRVASAKPILNPTKEEALNTTTTMNVFGKPNDNNRINEDEFTLGTIDDNRPIDQILVYSEDNNNSSNNSTNRNNRHTRNNRHHNHLDPIGTSASHTNIHNVGHRQRRTTSSSKRHHHYSSSNKSVISALGEGSFGHVENTPSGILESLGLAGGTTNGNHDQDNHNNMMGDTISASSKSIKQQHGSKHHVISSHRSTKQRMKKSVYGGGSIATGAFTNHHHASSSSSSPFKLNVRAFLTITTLLVFVFTFVQYTSILQKEANLMKQHRAGFVRRRGHTYNYNNNAQQEHSEFEEGVDRPVSAALLKQLHQNKNPSDIQLLQTKDKIPSANNGFLAEPQQNQNGFGGGGELVEGDEIVEQPLQGALSDSAGGIVAAAAGVKNEPLDEGPADPLIAPPANEEPDIEVDKSVSVSIEQGFAGVYEADTNHKDIPFLWFIPRSGSTIAKNIISQCLDLTVASEVGATLASKDSEKLEIEEAASHNYVNVDTTTVEGIERAKKLNLASSGFANLIVSPRLQEASTLFSSKYHGRAFTIIRHPVERSISMFYYLQKNKVAAVAKMTVEEYAKSPFVENNWMVRILSNTMEGPVGDSDLAVAKEVLRTKMLIGLLEKKELSMARFEYYFGWKYGANPVRQKTCKKRILAGDYRTNESAKHKVKEDSQAWNLIAWQNKYDIKLYKYAKSLFLQQATELFSEMPDLE